MFPDFRSDSSLFNARSDWLKERALSEYKARSVEKMADQFLIFASAF